MELWPAFGRKTSHRIVAIVEHFAGGESRNAGEGGCQSNGSTLAERSKGEEQKKNPRRRKLDDSPTLSQVHEGQSVRVRVRYSMRAREIS